MGLVDAGLADDGGGQEQEGRILIERDAVLVSDRRLSVGRFGFNRLSHDGQRAHGWADSTPGTGRQALPRRGATERAPRALETASSGWPCMSDALKPGLRPSARQSCLARENPVPE